MVPCRTLADTQGFGDVLGVVAAGGERRTSLVVQESHWAPARAPAVKINVQRYQRRNQGAARIELNTIPCEALAWNQPSEVHQGLVDSINLNFPEPEIPPTT